MRFGWSWLPGRTPDTPQENLLSDWKQAFQPQVVRRLARTRVREQLGRDSLHGAAMVTTARELGQGDAELQCILRGNRVRRFKEFDPMPPPTPTVRLL